MKTYFYILEVAPGVKDKPYGRGGFETRETACADAVQLFKIGGGVLSADVYSIDSETREIVREFHAHPEYRVLWSACHS